MEEKHESSSALDLPSKGAEEKELGETDGASDVRRKYLRGKAVSTAVIVLIISLTAVLILTNTYKCPLYSLFGIACPGCGMTRAYKALLRLNIAGAFEHHSLFPIPLLWLVRYMLLGKARISRRLDDLLALVSVLLFIIRWIIKYFLI